MEADEQDLLRNLLTGDETAFENFYNQIVPRWMRFFMSHRRPYRLTLDEAQDVVQQTMLVIFSKIPTFDPAGTATFSTWCYQIAIRTAIGRYRDKLKFTPIEEIVDAESLLTESLDEELNDGSDIISEDESLELWLKGDGEVQHALRSLKEVERRVILLKTIRGLTHKEIGNTLGKSEAAVRVCFHRVINKLKPLLEGVKRNTHEQ